MFTCLSEPISVLNVLSSNNRVTLALLSCERMIFGTKRVMCLSCFKNRSEWAFVLIGSEDCFYDYL